MATNYKKRAFYYRKNTGKALDNVKRIGVRSIFDIISDSTMSLKRKIDYIRHHYVYYEGNYDLFHDETGKATSTKYNLDRVIYEIIRGNVDPVVLSDFNKEIVKLRKQKDAEKQQIEEANTNEETLPGLPKYKLDILTHGGSIKGTECSSYINLIDRYMDTLDSKTKRQYFFNKSYREMRKLAETWNKAQEEPMEVKFVKPEEPDNGSFLKGYKKYAKSQGWN